MMQLIKSRDGRVEKKLQSAMPLAATIPLKHTEKYVIGAKLGHTRSTKASERARLKQYKTLEKWNFDDQSTHLATLATVYGKDSNVYKFKKEIFDSRNFGYGGVHGRHTEHTSHSMRELTNRELYWGTAEMMLTDTRMWLALKSSMNRYYQPILDRRTMAAIRIQVAIHLSIYVFTLLCICKHEYLHAHLLVRARNY
jgi:hypothetical protein